MQIDPTGLLASGDAAAGIVENRGFASCGFAVVSPSARSSYSHLCRSGER
ncbi:hypothetical protein [Telmatospirillum siberiense]|nr:hypothetical protein [Telmatospirillum siberiense]